ncbi:MAG: hypothetical protein ACLSTO_02040 [Bilophila wadsworthia]
MIELPEAVHQVVPVEIGPKARRVYTGLATAFYAELDVGEVTVANALVRLLRLQQVTGGHLKLDSGAVEQVDGAKQEALEDLLEGMGPEPCVVFCRFTSDIGAVKLACASLSLSCCELSGAANQLAEWQAGHHQVIAVQIQSGGAGVDFTRRATASTTRWASRSATMTSLWPASTAPASSARSPTIISSPKIPSTSRSTPRWTPGGMSSRPSWKGASRKRPSGPHRERT